MTSRALAALASAHGVLSDHRQQLGDADLPAAARARRRPRRPLGLEVSRRPQRRRGRRRRRAARADRPHPRARSIPISAASSSPFDAWLLIRGLRTLPVRMRAHEAARARDRPAPAGASEVDAVYHPGLASRCRRACAAHRACSPSSFRDGVDIRAFCDALRLFKLGVSWGGHESLVVPGEVVLQQKAQPNSAHRLRRQSAVGAPPCRPRRDRGAVDRPRGGHRAARQ